MGIVGWALRGDVDQRVLDARTVQKGQCCAVSFDFRTSAHDNDGARRDTACRTMRARSCSVPVPPDARQVDVARGQEGVAAVDSPFFR